MLSIGCDRACDVVIGNDYAIDGRKTMGKTGVSKRLAHNERAELYGLNPWSNSGEIPVVVEEFEIA